MADYRENADSPRNAFAYATYGTERANAYRILEDTLNLKDVRIYDKSVNENGDEIRVLNKKKLCWHHRNRMP